MASDPLSCASFFVLHPPRGRLNPRRKSGTNTPSSDSTSRSVGFSRSKNVFRSSIVGFGQDVLFLVSRSSICLRSAKCNASPTRWQAHEPMGNTSRAVHFDTCKWFRNLPSIISMRMRVVTTASTTGQPVASLGTAESIEDAIRRASHCSLRTKWPTETNRASSRPHKKEATHLS